MSSKSQQSQQSAPSPASTQVESAEQDIDYDVFEQLMTELQQPDPDPEACQRLFDAVGARGQELVLADATLGPKMRAIAEGEAEGGGWWDAIAGAASGALEAGQEAAQGALEGAQDVVEGGLDLAQGAVDTARGAVDTAKDAAGGALEAVGGALGGGWDPASHPYLEQLAAVPGQALEAGQSLWDQARGGQGPDEEQGEQAPETEPAEEVVEPIPVPDLGPRVVTRPGEPMYETSSRTGRQIIQEIEPVEVVEAVQVATDADRFGARVIDRYHIRGTDEASVPIDHWVEFGALSTDAELNEDFAADQVIPLKGLSGTSAAVARIWNEKGGFIDARRGGLERAVAVAVMKVESGGLGSSGAGEMVIRFENHKFWRSGEGISKTWGQDHPDLFDNHFRPRRGAVDHEINIEGADNGGTWQPFHGSQTLEWKAFELAKEVSGDPEAAICAISMGAGQVMGFNAQKLGYGSAVEMFEAFSSDAEANVGGVFSFIETNAEASAALEKRDFTAFVKQYNGDGSWVQDYVDMIVAAVGAFERLEAQHLADGGTA